MDTNTDMMPWDCLDTFGKRKYRQDPAQAHLCQWPIKLKLISPVAPFFHRAHLMLAADCAGYSYKNFHGTLLRNRILIIGCPELDGAEFGERLLAIIKSNDILSIAVTRMDAPCCKALADAVIETVHQSRKDIPVQITTVFAEGEIVV